MSNSVYSKEELFSMGEQRAFDSNAREAAFLLGGIGTGNVSIGSRGEFRDWEIFNKPGKGNILPYAFFAIWAREEGMKPLARVLESRLVPPFSKSHGFGSGETSGLPRFQESEMKGEYPLVWVSLRDAGMPVEVVLEAFTPFIPLNSDDSGIPCAVLKYKVKNLSSKKVDFTIAGSLPNMAGFNGYDEWGNPNEEFLKENVNEFRKGDGFSGLYLYSTRLSSNHLKYGNLSLATTAKNITVKPTWFEGVWFDGIQNMWDDFSSDGRLEYESDTGFEPSKHHFKTGSIGACEELNHWVRLLLFS